jgi:hypothetical protein
MEKNHMKKSHILARMRRCINLPQCAPMSDGVGGGSALQPPVSALHNCKSIIF